MQAQQKFQPIVHNSTHCSLEEIQTWKVIGLLRNCWRGRNVTLYEIPESDGTQIVSVGVTFDGAEVVVCAEQREAFKVTLERFPQPVVFR
jgi:hypothetical protein